MKAIKKSKLHKDYILNIEEPITYLNRESAMYTKMDIIIEGEEERYSYRPFIYIDNTFDIQMKEKLEELIDEQEVAHIDFWKIQNKEENEEVRLEKFKYPLELTERSRAILQRFGWYEGRRVNIESDLRILESYGSNVPENIKAFLREFLNIVIKYSREEEKSFSGLNFYEQNIEIWKKPGWDPISYMFGEKVVKIGLILDGNYNFYMSESGRFYSSEGKLGDNVAQMWNNILSEKINEIKL